MIPSTLVLAFLIVCHGTLAQADDPKPDPPVDARIKGFDDLYDAAVVRLYATKSEAEEKKASLDFQDLRRKLVDQALALASEHPGEPLAIDAWTWVIRRGEFSSRARTQAIESLRRDALKSDRVGDGCQWAANSNGLESLEAERLLREVIEANPHREVRGRAQFYLAELLESRADMVRDLDTLPVGFKNFIGEVTLKQLAARPFDDLFREAEDHYGLVTRDFANLKSARPGKTLGEVAQGRVYKLRNLAIGRTLPEIVGEDVEGKPLKLSDHQGKVILLTFSGLWCPSCHNLYPQERDLLKRYASRPFAVLSVDTDETREPLRKAIASGEITWPCWFDGGKGGPITLRSGIYYFPTIYLIDHKGVIRAKDIVEKPLDAMVEALVKDAERH